MCTLYFGKTTKYIGFFDRRTGSIEMNSSKFMNNWKTTDLFYLNLTTTFKQKMLPKPFPNTFCDEQLFPKCLALSLQGIDKSYSIVLILLSIVAFWFEKKYYRILRIIHLTLAIARATDIIRQYPRPLVRFAHSPASSQ